jgi:predicted nucleic acid-binding protein
VPITDAVAEHAGNIAAANRIRGCDSVYVAVADMLDDYLVTLDKEQLERGGSVVPTREP